MTPCLEDRPNFVYLFFSLIGKLDGNYREMRYFTPWQRGAEIEHYYLEDIVADITNQHTVPFGDAVIRTKETTIGSSTYCTLYASEGLQFCT
jgi:hypothetical protein